MDLERTIQRCFDRAPIMFRTRMDVLTYMFCWLGTGFKWKKGELVDESPLLDAECEVKIGNDGRAVQRYSADDAALKFLFETFLKNKQNMTYNEFLEAAASFKLYMEEVGSPELEAALVQSKSIVDSFESVHVNDLDKMMSRTYSPIFKVPRNIKEDWKMGLEEVRAYLLECNIEL